MAQSSTSPPPAYPSIISPQFCAPTPVDLSIVRKVMAFKHDEFVVMNIDENILFKVKVGSFCSLHESRVLVDAAENLIVTLRRKVTAPGKWYAYKGDSKDPSDLLFTVKQSSMLHWKTKFYVFLANNTEEKVCDFKVKGSWSEKSCVVYAGESSTIVAQMHKNSTIRSWLGGKENYTVTVYPNVDYGFIVTLMVILSLSWSR